MSSSSDAPSPSPAADPCFSGVWRSCGHENMEAFLIGRGFSSANAALASRAVVVQTIAHSRRRLLVDAAGTASSYTITNAALTSEEQAELEAAQAATQEDPAALAAAIFEKVAEWVAAEKPGAPRQLVSSTGEIETTRALLEDGRMLVTISATSEEGEALRATTTFVKEAEASTPSPAPADNSEPETHTPQAAE